MKAIIALSVLLTATISYAGPEDHFNDQTCYTIAAEDYPKAASELPLEICFEKVQLHLTILNSNLKEDSIELYSYFSIHSQYLNNLKLTEYIRVTEDEYSYKASSVLVDREERHCEDSVKITLDVDGHVSAVDGVGDIAAQNITLTQVTKADVCHSNYDKHVFKYQRTR
jgi:hypothetical protein